MTIRRTILGLSAAALAVGGLGLAVPTIAHHAFASEFDSSRPIVLSGTITRARFVNPHSWVYLDVRGADGTVTNWGFEFGTPSSLRSNGLTRETIQAGTRVRIAGFRAKNGGPFGYSTTLVLQDGRRFATGSAPDAPAPPIN
jgi:hypothetical protein